MKILLTFADADIHVAEELCRCIEREDLSCWLPSRDAPGLAWSKLLVAAMRTCDVMLFIHSAAANESETTIRSLDEFTFWGKPVVVYRIAEVPVSAALASNFRRATVIASAGTSQHDMNALIEGLRQCLAKVRPKASPQIVPMPRPAKRPTADIPRPTADDEPFMMADLGSPAEDEDDQFERAGSPELPLPVTDLVHFSITAPATVSAGASFLIDAWAHLDRHRDEVLRRARLSSLLHDDIIIREKGPVGIARGSTLRLRLHPMDGFHIEDNEDTVFWDGEIGNASFPVQAVAGAQPGPRNGTVTVFLLNLPIAKIHFTLSVGAGAAAPANIPAETRRFRTAFASYASEDRDQVLRIVQGLQKGAPDLDVFVDVVDLRSGQRWEQELWKVIPTRDVFYLFWSRAAAKSAWVEREWRVALEKRGLDFIDPAPLEPRRVAPPPAELTSLHFNDWVLAYLRAGLPL